MNKDQIIEELNIKAVEQVGSYSDLVKRELAPNFATLGEKYGDGVTDVTDLLKNFSYDDFAKEIRNSGTMICSKNGLDYELTREDVRVKDESLEGKSAVTDGGLTVAVVTDLTDELIQEGYVRDMVRHVQNMRKEADFNVEDRITVNYHAKNSVSEAIKKFEGYFRNEVLAVELTFGDVEGELTKEISIGGEKIVFGISRVKE